MVIIKVKVGMGEKEVVVIIIKKFIIGIRTLKLNLFSITVNRDARRSDCSDKYKGVRQQGIIKY